MATALKSPPSIRVALVKTTVLSVSSLSRIGPHTSSGATQSRGGKRSPPSASQSTSDSRSAAIRSALTKTSWTNPRAWVRAGVDALGVGVLGVRREAGARGVADQHQGVAELLRHRVEATGRRGRDRVGQGVGRIGEVVGLGALDVPLGTPGRPLDVGDAHLVGGGLGHPGDDLVGLVDDDGVVLRDHRDALDRVDREQRVVGDDQVAALGLVAGQLDEALRAERALRCAQAVAVADADLPPLAVGVAGRPVALTAASAPRSPPRPTSAARGPSCRSSPRARRRECPGRRARPRGCGAGRRSWSAP